MHGKESVTQNATSCTLMYHLSVILPVRALLLSSQSELKVFTCQRLVLLSHLSLLTSSKLPSLSAVICNFFQLCGELLNSTEVFFPSYHLKSKHPYTTLRSNTQGLLSIYCVQETLAIYYNQPSHKPYKVDHIKHENGNAASQRRIQASKLGIKLQSLIYLLCDIS